MHVGGSTHCCTDMTWQTRVMTRICAVHDPHLLEIASPMPPSHDGRSCGTTDVSSAYAACFDHHPITSKMKAKSTGTRLTESPTKTAWHRGPTQKTQRNGAPLMAPPQVSHATSPPRIETYGKTKPRAPPNDTTLQQTRWTLTRTHAQFAPPKIRQRRV